MSSYQNIYYDRNTNLIHLWDDTKGYMKFPFKRYGYKKSSTGKFTALDGSRVEKVTGWNKDEESKGIMYESDIRPEVRTLIDMYYESDDISLNHREMFIDIEVSGEGGHATTSNVKNPITAISFYMRNENQYYALLLDTAERLENFKKDNLQLMRFNNEENLIQAFLALYTEKAPTIITGWNIDKYDIPYLYNRIEKVFDISYANLLSPIGIVLEDKYLAGYVIAGVSCLDYMQLYKRYTYSEQSSYALEAICQLELGKGKIKYEGTLDDLFATDVNKFIEYNVNDVELVAELDNKLKFIDLAKGVAHKGHVPYQDIYKTTRFLDGACLVYMKRLGIIAPNVKRNKTVSDDEVVETDFEGAYVREPVPGRYEWVFDVDMGSLYPSIIRTLNISPETKVGRITNWSSVEPFLLGTNNSSNNALETLCVDNEKSNIKVSEIKNLLLQNNYSVSSIGVLYDMNKPGIVPSILKTWMQEREDARGLAKKYGKEGDMAKRNFYDGRQLTLKIINNSLYGALGSSGFRFYDLDNAESITLVGQSVLKNHVVPTINKWFKEYINIDKDNVLYVDTDSIGGESLIHTDLYGDITVKDLYNKYIESEISDISKRGFVFPSIKSTFYNQLSKTIEFGDIRYIEKHKVCKKFYKIKCSNGKEVRVTEDHSVMVLQDDGTVIEKKPIELSPIDKIITII